MVRQLAKSPQAQFLEALRRRAGFPSARDAANHFGWSPSMYRSHESGVRPVRHEDAARDARGLGATADQIMAPPRSVLVETLGEVRRRDDVRRFGGAARLKALRVLSGFDTAAEFCRAWEVVPGSYVKLETGQNGLRSETAAFYGAIHGVSPEWLAEGTLPSGLVRELDANIAEFVRRPADFRRFARTGARADLDAIRQLRKKMVPGRPSKGGVAVIEASPDELRRSKGRLGTKWNSNWTIPAAFFAATAVDPKDVVAVVVEEPTPGLAVGERIFLCLGASSPTGFGYLASSGGRMRITKRKPLAGLLGAVIGRMRPPGSRET